MKLLAVGDLHLGRIPTRIPRAQLESGSADGRPAANALSPHEAWAAAVRHAIDECVDAVVLAGDVIDGDNQYFESRYSLEIGVAKLREAGIPAFAVAGNHDARVLPKVIESIEGIELIGGDGRWEIRQVERDGRRVGHLLGWSFPDSHHKDDPTVDLPDRLPTGEPVIGLVHGDLDQPSSPYAPLSRTRLESAGAMGWLLGHVHVPNEWSTGTRVGYLGTACALDPGEVGPRSIWIVESSAADFSMTPIPVSPIQYDEIRVEAEPDDDGKALGHRVGESTERAAKALAPSVRVHVIRVGVTGAVERPDEATEELARYLDFERESATSHGSVDVVLDDLRCSLSPRLDLEELARGDDPIGIAANWLRAVRALREDDTTERPSWFAAAQDIAREHDHREFAVGEYDDDRSAERFTVDVDDDLERVLTEIVSTLDAQRRERDARESAR